MLIVLSPAKTLDYETPPATDDHTTPDFIAHAQELAAVLKGYTPPMLESLMSISAPLAELNARRFASWSPRFTARNSKQAIFAFNGDVYDGLDAGTLTPKQVAWTQSHVRILSGLYGVLRPLDRMQPYRLEMGTRLANPRGKDLYAFWGTTVTEALNATIAAARAKALVNLASDEYFRVVKPTLLSVPVITPVFEDWKGGRYKVISFFAKRARGAMARYAATRGIADPERLKGFDADGYAYAPEVSDARHWVFRRRIAD